MQREKTVAVALLRHLSFVIDFMTRVKVFRSLVETERESRGMGGRNIFRSHGIEIHRPTLYQDAFSKLNPSRHGQVMTLKDAALGIRMVDENGIPEAGIDGGGVFREFLQQCCKAGFDPALALFTTSSDNRIYPNPAVDSIFPDSAAHYRFLGNVIGRVMLEGLLVEVPFSRFFLTKMLGKRALLNDLSSLDPELHRHLLQIKSFDAATLEQLSLDFSVTDGAIEGHQTHDLILNGRNIPVTIRNRIQYIYLIADYRLNRRITRQTAAFLTGLKDIIDPHWFAMFGPDELQMLLSGTEEGVDIEDMRRNVVLNGYDDRHPTMIAFWKVMRSLPAEDIKDILKFITSCPRPPLQGFGFLVPRIAIHNTGDVSRLPTASTCMNLLKLPPYDSEEVLRSKLLFAVKNNLGFGLS